MAYCVAGLSPKRGEGKWTTNVWIFTTQNKRNFLYFIIIKDAWRLKSALPQKSHPTLSPALFYNNKIRNTADNHIKKSYQQDKGLILCGLLPVSVPVTLPVYRLIS